jgi:lipid-A-disaccharide synthase
VPEILQDDATPENLATALGNLLEHKRLRAAMKEAFADIHVSLRKNNPERLREALEPFLARNPRGASITDEKSRLAQTVRG